jgi:hypothetical protein
MPTLRTGDRVPAWDAEPMLPRLAKCVAMLSIHGILPDRQRQMALDRIRKKFARFARRTPTLRRPARELSR